MDHSSLTVAYILQTQVTIEAWKQHPLGNKIISAPDMYWLKKKQIFVTHLCGAVSLIWVL